VLAGLLLERARACAVAQASVAEIERLNILGATLLAMRRAVEALATVPTEVWIDGNRAPDLAFPVRTVVGGDASVAAISAASILAKTARDRMMRSLARDFPGYGFERHMGYGTAEHCAALRRLGPCPEHRRSFAPVRALLAGPAGAAADPPA